MAERNEKIKLYLVIGLLAVAAVLAYFRFFHSARPPGGEPRPATGADAPQLAVPPVTLPPREPPAAEPPPAARPEIARDIFAPASWPAPAEPRDAEAAAGGQGAAAGRALPALPPGLVLKGTLVGGGKAMAVINGAFVRLGDSVGDYRVVSIQSNEVVLRAGEHEVTLEVSKAEKK